MKRNWKELPKDDTAAAWAGLYVTMNPKGRISMSRVTYHRVGAPAAFLILFDAVNNVIGLKATHLAARNAYRPCAVNSNGGRAIFANRLINEYAIRLPDTIRFQDPEIDQDGVLVLDLRTAKISERSWKVNGRRKREQSQPPAAVPSDLSPQVTTSIA
ncbi:MAG: hypothetical protein IPM59_14385 [Chloracidobacterium sp.]|nr:hypothetical protein [Chloracidobacterium sp.]